MFTQINFATATARELRAWAKENQVPGYSPYVKKGVQSLRNYLRNYKEAAEQSCQSEAECEDLLVVEPAKKPETSFVELTRAEKAIALAVDSAIATYDAGELCGEFYFNYVHERLLLAVGLMLMLSYAAALGWVAAFQWTAARYQEWREPLGQFVAYHSSTAFYAVVEAIYDASKYTIESGQAAAVAWGEDKELALCYASFVGLSLVVLH